MTDVSISLPAKRRRGRPRKDGNVSREGSLRSPENSNTQRVGVINPTLDGLKNNNTQEVDRNPKYGTVDGMVGSMIYGVIEGSFDAGYLISVRIGNNDTPFRGVIFQPKKFIPITAANDVAPQAMMYQRREITVPLYDPQPQKVALPPERASKQAILHPILPSIPLSVNPYAFSNQPTLMLPEAMMLRTSSFSNMGGKCTIPITPRPEANQQSPSVHPRTAEHDEMMHAFEVSTSSKATTSSLPCKEITNQKLGTSMFALNKPKSSNIELHHNFMENMPGSSAFGIHQGEMICREMEHQREFIHNGLQNPNIEPQIHSVHQETQQTDLYYNEMRGPDVNFHHDLFTDQSQPDSREPKPSGPKFHPGSMSPNLKLDLSSSIHEKKTNYLGLNELKSPNLGYHRALVAGNPLLLPPDLIGEPLEFMMEKDKSIPNSNTQQENSTEAVNSPSAPYKLELATPQSTLNTRSGEQTNCSDRCITDMDFVLSDVIQPTEHHERQGDISETKHR